MGRVLQFVNNVLGRNKALAAKDFKRIAKSINNERAAATALYQDAIAQQKKILKQGPLAMSLHPLRDGKVKATEDIVSKYIDRFDKAYLERLGIHDAQAVYNNIASLPKFKDPTMVLPFGNIAESPFLAKAKSEIARQAEISAAARQKLIAPLLGTAAVGGVGADIYNKNN